jgi:3-(3-hydroxy-phenyl)propionate hydroxylase
MTERFDVVVIGFGPAGATCANLLGKLGVRTLVVDKSRTVYDMPRAFAIDHEIMRVYQALGIADAIARHTRPFTPSEYYGVDGQLIKRLGSVQPPYPLGWPPNLVFTQPPVEAALRTHAAAWHSVTVALGEELVALVQTSDHVTLELRDGGKTRTVEARYVVGCDGASSTVRTLTGLQYVDLEFDEPWLVIDLLVSERGLAKLPEVSVQYCEPARPATYLIGPDNHRRWEIMVMPDEDRRELEKEENVWRLLSRWVSPEDATLWRRASYRFHALVAEEWRSGRAFIAGDAAHQQPPFTGQGMCQGVRDVANLTWKLERVLRGESSDALLDTYASERREHVKRLTTVIKGIGRVICERDAQAARARDERMLAEAGGNVTTQPRQDLIPPLSCGLLSPLPHAANGTIFPQPRIRQSNETVLLDTIAGTGFRVVTNHKSIVEGLRDAALTSLDMQLVHFTASAKEENAGGQTQSGALSVTEVERVVDSWFQRHQCSAAIVRPDHYVFGVAANGTELERQIEALRAALA